jgi:hypothetical protein
MVISDKILTIGSCFSDTIGQSFAQNKMSVCPNPFGTLYNPPAIFKALRYALFNEIPPTHTFIQHQDIFLNYDFHSEVSAQTEDLLRTRLAEIIGATHHFLVKSEWLIITFGTAWVYTRKDSGEIVANCHKQPASHFTKSLISAEMIVDLFKDFHRELSIANPTVNIILTVSPVRHLKDTLEMNSVSKSILRTCCHELTEAFSNVEYFPSFEIMMDDLRDYRFYESDMIHPTEVARDYIWEKFGERYFSPSLRMFMHEWKDILRALTHKPFHPTSRAHQTFLAQTLERLKHVQNIVNVEKEIESIQAQCLPSTHSTD